MSRRNGSIVYTNRRDMNYSCRYCGLVNNNKSDLYAHIKSTNCSQQHYQRYQREARAPVALRNIIVRRVIQTSIDMKEDCPICMETFSNVNDCLVSVCCAQVVHVACDNKHYSLTIFAQDVDYNSQYYTVY